MALKLFYFPGACSLAVHIVLEWLAQPYDAVRIKYGSPEFLRINPAGRVPVLDTGEGWTLSQAGAILLYLGRRFPDARIGPDGSLREQAEFDRWSSFFTGDLHPAFFPVFTPDRYTTDRDDEALSRVRDAGLKLVRKELALLEDHMREREFTIGDRRTVIDAYAFPILRWADARLPETLAAYPAIKTLYNRIAEDGAVRKVLADEGLH